MGATHLAGLQPFESGAAASCHLGDEGMLMSAVSVIRGVLCDQRSAFQAAAASRWEGVPWIMKAGKALNERKVEIRVQYKPPAASIHGELINEMRNELVVRLLCKRQAPKGSAFPAPLAYSLIRFRLQCPQVVLVLAWH